MATPKRGQVANRNLAQYKYKSKITTGECNKQFPECPKEPNKNDCNTCPFFNK